MTPWSFHARSSRHPTRIQVDIVNIRLRSWLLRRTGSLWWLFECLRLHDARHGEGWDKNRSLLEAVCQICSNSGSSGKVHPRHKRSRAEGIKKYKYEPYARYKTLFLKSFLGVLITRETKKKESKSSKILNTSRFILYLAELQSIDQMQNAVRGY